MNNSQKTPDDESFIIEVSNDMELRNILRKGLVKAQDKDTEKIPLLISWPEWLEDGIVCLYARDFYNVLSSAIRDTAVAISAIIETSGENKHSADEDEGV